jgi:hypothetical protein
MSRYDRHKRFRPNRWGAPVRLQVGRLPVASHWGFAEGLGSFSTASINIIVAHRAFADVGLQFVQPDRC